MTRATPLLVVAALVQVLLAVSTAPSAVRAEPSEWVDVVQAVLGCPAVEQTDGNLHEFSRDIATLRNAVHLDKPLTGEQLAPVATFLTKVKEIRGKYIADIEGGAVHDAKPHVLVVGAGPLGLATALMIAKRGTHRVTVLEKTDGKDDRWNGIVATHEFRDLLENDLGLAFTKVPAKGEGEEQEAKPSQPTSSPWIGQLPEMEYVFAAALKIIGVHVRYNALYVGVCPNKGGTKPTVTVHAVPTPKNSALRYKLWGREELCTEDTKTTITDFDIKGKKYEGHLSYDSVDVVVGADGTTSAVRRTLMTESNAEDTDDSADKTFPAVRSVKGEFVPGETAPVNAPEFRIVDDPSKTEAISKKQAPVEGEELGKRSKPAREMEDPFALLTHVIFSFKGTPAEQWKVFKTGFMPQMGDNALSPRPTAMDIGSLLTGATTEFKDAVPKNEGIEVPVVTDVEGNDREKSKKNKRKKKKKGKSSDIEVSEPRRATARTVMTRPELGALVASIMPHYVNYVDAEGKLHARTYGEYLLRHEASKSFRAIFGDFLGKETGVAIEMSGKGDIEVIRDLFDAPYDTVNKDAVRTHRLNGEGAKNLLAKKLLPFLRRLAIASTEEGHLLFPDQQTFNEKLEHIKIFNQQVRGAAQVARNDGGIKAFLVGDAARDSYYAHGNSVNSAVTALHEHLDGLLSDDGEAWQEAATKYKKRVVDDFTNFIGTDIYARTYCGCTPSSVLHYLKALQFSSITCHLREVSGELPKYDVESSGLTINTSKKSKSGKHRTVDNPLRPCSRRRMLSFKPSGELDASDCTYPDGDDFRAQLEQGRVCDAL